MGTAPIPISLLLSFCLRCRPTLPPLCAPLLQVYRQHLVYCAFLTLLVGPPPGFSSESTATLKGLGLDLGLGEALGSTSSQYGSDFLGLGLFGRGPPLSSSAALDLLLNGEGVPPDSSSALYSGAAPPPMGAPAGKEKDYFKSKSGLVIRL